ncbi:M23 family metallopeptidase [Nonomuraea turcica]|uniref:M23 family metallopeptidase n=1 Tax=Nonomuraea sp. G32 TaxID=3067274 RepID=UPI00273AEF21|nr:M23 family metallopeptidase [Nonomuraea sp. G32]MDP4504560.1 M23 family metallopeptidase [Nonomuraea sp. G32]
MKSHAAAVLATILATALFPLTAPPASASPPTWRWPLDGHPRILRRFTPPPEPWLAGHRGIDLAAPAATPVLAAGEGIVRFAGPVAGKGVVTIDHEDGLRTTYLPVAASVKRGQPVTPGTELGVIEPSGDHCPESCLHWGLLRETGYLNPLVLLGHGPIRLLPFWPPRLPPATTPPPPQMDQPPLPARTEAKTRPTSTTTTAVTASRQTSSHTPTPPSPLNGYDLSSATSARPAPTITVAVAAALLGTAYLITALHRRRRRRRTPTSDQNSRKGQHRKRRHSRHARGARDQRSSPAPPP